MRGALATRGSRAGRGVPSNCCTYTAPSTTFRVRVRVREGPHRRVEAEARTDSKSPRVPWETCRLLKKARTTLENEEFCHFKGNKDPRRLRGTWPPARTEPRRFWSPFPETGGGGEQRPKRAVSQGRWGNRDGQTEERDGRTEEGPAGKEGDTDLRDGNSKLKQRKTHRKWSFYLPQGTREYEMLKKKKNKQKQK